MVSCGQGGLDLVRQGRPEFSGKDSRSRDGGSGDRVGWLGSPGFPLGRAVQVLADCWWQWLAGHLLPSVLNGRGAELAGEPVQRQLGLTCLLGEQSELRVGKRPPGSAVGFFVDCQALRYQSSRLLQARPRSWAVVPNS
jgi:hypothetical protein